MTYDDIITATVVEESKMDITPASMARELLSSKRGETAVALASFTEAFNEAVSAAIEAGEDTSTVSLATVPTALRKAAVKALQDAGYLVVATSEVVAFRI